MKRLLFSTLLAVSALAGMAQEQYKVFAELLGHQKRLFSNQVNVTVDFGQKVSFWKPGDMKIVDNEGRDVVFNSMVDAMNFMGKNGWHFEQAYVVTVGNQNVYHWLMSKMISSDDEIKSGFNVKADIKEPDKFVITYLRKRKTSSQWDVVKTEGKSLTPDEATALSDEWKSQSDDTYDYDCQIKKDK